MIDDRLGEVRKTDDGDEPTFERRLAQPIEKVWAALTVPERIARVADQGRGRRWRAGR
jgi:uncharacterized protein YndB with AHSA1/START domain